MFRPEVDLDAISGFKLDFYLGEQDIVCIQEGIVFVPVGVEVGGPLHPCLQSVDFVLVDDHFYAELGSLNLLALIQFRFGKQSPVLDMQESQSSRQGQHDRRVDNRNHYVALHIFDHEVRRARVLIPLVNFEIVQDHVMLQDRFLGLLLYYHLFAVKQVYSVLQNLPLPHLQLLPGSAASVKLGNIDRVLEQYHVVFPDLKQDVVECFFCWDDDGMVEMNGVVLELRVGVGVGEVEVVVVEEREVLIFEVPLGPEMQMVEVYADVLLHKALLIHQFHPSITMFHLIETNTLNLRKQQTARALFVVPLSAARLALITDDNALTLYSVTKPAILERIVLSHTPRKVAPVGDNTLVLLFPQKQTLEAVTFGRPKSEQMEVVHTFLPTTHYLLPKNPVKQKQYFSTMSVVPFLLSSNLYVQEQNPEGRKCCLRFFSRQKGIWESRAKELGLNYQQIAKMDERQTLALFSPSIETNRSFRFRMLSGSNLVEQQIDLESESFTDFAIIIAVKKAKDQLFLQVNRKNPEIICFRNYRQSSSEQMSTNAIWVVSLGPFLFSLCFSEKEGNNAKLQIRSGTKLEDEFHGKFDNTNLSKEGLLVEYQRQRDARDVTEVSTYRPIKKDKLYLHLLSKGFPKVRQKNTLFNDVLWLLDV